MRVEPPVRPVQILLGPAQPPDDAFGYAGLRAGCA